MYVETIINGKPLQAMLGTGVDMVYMAKELVENWACPTPRRSALSRGPMQEASPLRALLGVPSSKSASGEARPMLPLPLWMIRNSI